MIIYYLKIAVRNLIKYRLYSTLNIAGLALGIASFLLIGLYIVDELSYDRYHQRSDRIYRVGQISDFGGVGENSASLPFPAAFALKNEYPDMIENVVRVFNFQSPRTLVEHEDKKYIETGVFFADSTFFEIFDHKFLKGDPETALDETFMVVITEKAAEKYFGDEDPMGKTLKVEGRFPFQVAGVIADVPSHSHFHFDFIASMSSVKHFYRGHLPQTWVWNPCWTYLLLHKNVDGKHLEKALLPQFVQKYFFDAEKDNITLHLQKLIDIHLHSRLDYEIEPNSSITYIYILSAIAVFLLVIAAINFMNLSTATSAGRSKEIGIKKVVGAYRTQLIRQFLSESILLTIAAAVIALIIAEISMPWFNNFTGKSISLGILLEWPFLLYFAGLIFFIGLISGLYPAFYLSSFRPIWVLKMGIKRSHNRGFTRKILVITQFTISIALIIGTIIIFKQLEYLKNANTGFTRENIIVLPISRTPIIQQYKTFKNELLNNPMVESATTMDYIFGTAYNTHEFRPEGYPENEWQFYPCLVVEYDFAKTFDLKILAGRDYCEANKTDAEKGILINKAMVDHLGWGAPEDAIGKKFHSLQGQERVIGVIDNFNATSLHKASGPFVLNIKETPGGIAWFMNYMAIRVKPGEYSELLEFLESKWNTFVKDRPFEYSFMDHELNRLYHDERNLSRLSLIFTILVIFISSLGLFGLAAFMTEKRTKEIGIRKVLGANPYNIIRILSVEFIQLMLIANIIAWPVAYLVLKSWLGNFAYQTEISILIFILSGMFALFLALLVSAAKTIQASRTNPVDILKYE